MRIAHTDRFNSLFVVHYNNDNNIDNYDDDAATAIVHVYYQNHLKRYIIIDSMTKALNPYK